MPPCPSAGEAVNAAGSDGRTPLHLAASSGHDDAVNALLDAGAAPGLVGLFSLAVQPPASSQPLPQLPLGGV